MSYSGWLKKIQNLFQVSHDTVRKQLPKRAYKRLVVLSDIHYPSKTRLAGAPYMAKMAAKEEALADINRWHDVDLAVFTGDMVQREGSQSEYATVRSFLRRLRKHKAFVAGNHELLYTVGAGGRLTTGGLADRILHFKRYTRFFGPLYYTRKVGGYLLVFLSPDAVADNNAAVELSQQQLAWLSQTLTENKTYPTIIFCHAPLSGTALPAKNGEARPASRNAVQPAAAIDQILKQQPQVKLWVSGHTHTRPGDADFMDAVNYYDGRILNVYNADWDDGHDIFTNSIYLFADKIVIRTYSHGKHCFLPWFDRVVALGIRSRKAA